MPTFASGGFGFLVMSDPTEAHPRPSGKALESAGDDDLASEQSLALPPRSRRPVVLVWERARAEHRLSHTDDRSAFSYGDLEVARHAHR